MKKKNFGSRSKAPFSGQETSGNSDKYSKVDFLRGVLAAAIQQFDGLPLAERDSAAMRIRVLQDQLAELKRLSGAKEHRSDTLRWVDIWRPD